MLWFSLACLCGLLIAIQGAFAKSLMARVDAAAVSWASIALAGPFYGAWILFRGIGTPSPHPVFFVYLSAGVLLNIVAVTLYYKALRVGELSRDVALLSLSPVFMMVTTRVMVGQTLSWTAAAAMLVVVGGCFMVQRQAGVALRALPKTLVREKSSRYMLATAFLWSLTSNLDKLCISEVGPAWYSLLFAGAFAVAFLPFLWRARRTGPILEGKALSWRPLLALGVLQAAAGLSQMTAVEAAPHVAYAITLKRGALIVGGMAAGAVIFREKNLSFRLTGALVILIGLAGLALAAA